MQKMQATIVLCLSALSIVFGQDTWQIAANGIVLGSSPRVAGAIDSLTWNGVQFINAFDHGRELQVAITDGRGECYNPTEAGGNYDSTGPGTHSVLQGINLNGNILRTLSLPAFWLAPGEQEANPTPNCHAGVNPTLTSNWQLSKAVQIGYGGIGNCIGYIFSFIVGIPGETFIQVEAPTGYMPQYFSSFYSIDLASGQLTPQSYGPGEIPVPLVFATPNGGAAMGAILIAGPTSYRSYARFYFPFGPASGAAKWSNVWRGNGAFQQGQTLAFTSVVCVGNLPMVVACMRRIGEIHPEVIKMHHWNRTMDLDEPIQYM
eukprot:TRINITY_DN1272_c0_g1_i1.p2 TRINITY_DN1272_c0_g1~~TRINITY_DN1272_c0_g1_i1.p2  ORF type:complete len:318 (-),score=61.82 TRINITY_DN1272_c0_g1_i1:216-1169(-)